MRSVAQPARTRASAGASTANASTAGGWTDLATDGELLGVYCRTGDQLAFSRLVDRHGTMVAAVCRRVLRNEHDADDALQATFLLLARHGRSVRGGESLAGWLYRVAFRTAIAARKRRLRRREEPLPAVEALPAEEAFPDLTGRHAVGVLMQELALLPEQYRTPLVMRHLEGQSRRAIAERTDATIAAVQGRLARGAKLLRQKMLRRGVSFAAAVTTLAAASGRAAASPDALRLTLKYAVGDPGAVSPTAASLYHEGVRTMLIATLAKPLAVAAAASLLALAAVAPAAWGDGPAGQTEGLSLSTAVELGGDDPSGADVVLAGNDGAVAAEGESLGLAADDRLTVQVTAKQGPQWRADDANSKQRLSEHEGNLIEAIERVDESMAELEESLGFTSGRLADKRKQLLSALESVRVMQIDALASDAYVGAILASTGPKPSGPSRGKPVQAPIAALQPASPTPARHAYQRPPAIEHDLWPQATSTSWAGSPQNQPSRPAYFPHAPQQLGPLGDPNGGYTERNKAYGYSVQQLQERLNLVLDPSPMLKVDGDLGPASTAAVKRFQQQAGLPSTGVADQATRTALGLFGGPAPANWGFNAPVNQQAPQYSAPGGFQQGAAPPGAYAPADLVPTPASATWQEQAFPAPSPSR
ncbi:ECF RNA polymerase sigma factor SigE [Pirellulimonas nuda]|uniref:ECF RNA polymerase sigma factor SigE n=1 Tax=Pirellulimonas nuda TaxID=2528009 RepID=A0A518DIB1_9BACT|nr:sigma-70 family RNA polymerase sigma factor [Pirellulimonas nuda]QDU91223.1 ECF RNA polymerase sigma factor SigE [Pirellulimonas nuda]